MQKIRKILRVVSEKTALTTNQLLPTTPILQDLADAAPIKKKKDKNVEKITKTISYKIKLIDSARFMASSWSKLINNLAKGINKIKCKDYETCGIQYKDCECCLEYKSAKDDFIE